jgi:hypothetical protein
MALFREDTASVALVASLQREVAMLREFLQSKEADILALRNDHRVLQEALISKESPQAYRDMRMAEEAALAPAVDPAELVKQREMNEANRLILRELEYDRPLFRDAEDMIDSLSRVAGGPRFNSLHENSES